MLRTAPGSPDPLRPAASGALSDEHLGTLDTVFRVLDEDGDGLLTCDEAQHAFLAVGIPPVRALIEAAARKSSLTADTSFARVRPPAVPTHIDFVSFVEFVEREFEQDPIKIEPLRRLFYPFRRPDEVFADAAGTDPASAQRRATRDRAAGHSQPTGSELSGGADGQDIDGPALCVPGFAVRHVLSEIRSVEQNELSSEAVDRIFEELELDDTMPIDVVELAKALSSGFVSVTH